MTGDFAIVGTDDVSVGTCALCGASPLGHERKREWIRQCLGEGLRYKTAVRRATDQTVGMIEYMPGETTWRSVHAPSYMVIHCVQVPKQHRGRGIGSMLVQESIDDARRHGMDGVVALATQKGWCADSRIYLKHGFEVIDWAPPSLELMVKRLREAEPPSFGDWQERLNGLGNGIYMYVSKQCPFTTPAKLLARREGLRSKYGLDANVIAIADHKAAQANPCMWGTSGIV